jgi:DNA-binding transcriptional LysR family regulator
MKNVTPARKPVPSDPIETAELLAFAKIIEAKSLSRAALELGVPRATIGRRLARLESRLGARLLRRTTRNLVLTDAGETLYRHARIVLAAVHDAESSLRQRDQVVRGDLRVSVPPINWPSFYRMLSEFAREFPALRLHVHFTTALADLRRDGYDVAIRASDQLEPGLIARTLAPSPLIAVAAPSYLAEHGEPRTLKDLRDHRCVMGFARGELPQTHWPAGASRLQVDGSFFTNDMGLLCEAARSGLGIALIPFNQAAPLLADGQLKHVLQDLVYADARLSIVYLEREFVPPQVRAFVERVQRWASTELQLEPARQCVPEEHRARHKRVRANAQRSARRPGQKSAGTAQRTAGESKGRV